MKTIPMRNRAGDVVAHALVDDEDFERLGHLRWSLGSKGYPRRVVTVDGKQRTILLHAAVMGPAPAGHVIDHESRNRLDAQRGNLRFLPKRVHLQNISAKRGGTSRHRGVSFCAQTGRWRAGATIDGRKVWAGRFDTEDEAAAAAAELRRAGMPYSEEGMAG